MANMKTIAFISCGVVAAFGVIIGMNVGASTQSEEGFEGGVTEQRLSRQLPESNADPFQVISDEDEAARRATSNRRIADEELLTLDSNQSYTAPPVIHMEGSSGDGLDPMASAIVPEEVRPAPVALEQPVIEPVQAPERDYKVPEQAEATPEEAEQAPADTLALEALLRSMQNSTGQRVSIQTFPDQGGRGNIPMTVKEYQGSNRSASGGNRGLAMSPLPDRVETFPNIAPPASSTLPDPANQIPEVQAPQSQPEPATSGVLRTIDPNTPSSYTEGALQKAFGYDAFAAVSTKHDSEYDWRQPYRVAQAAIGIDNNSRIYDTARNAQSFDAGSLLLPGDQRYATLMYGFNSDDAAQLPVFAQLHDYGPGSSAFLNGARVQGNLRLGSESAVMEFDRLILQDGRVVPISAMGISADQGRVGISENVNRHVLSRYSALLVSGLIKGVGDVGTRIIDNRYDTNSGTTIIIGDNASGDTEPRDTFSDADRAAIAMGAVKPIGDELASAAGQGFSRAPTVTAPAGFGFSIVFLEGLTFGQVQ